MHSWTDVSESSFKRGFSGLFWKPVPAAGAKGKAAVFTGEDTITLVNPAGDKGMN